MTPDIQVETAIAEVARRYLQRTERLDPEMPFALLGIDSLGTIELAAALEDSLGCRLPPDVMVQCRDARSLAARITQLLNEDEIAERDDPFEQMLADAVLPPDVSTSRRGAVSTDLRSAKRILLSGATGFLGGALLDELLDSTGAEVVALTRRPVAGRRRVHVVEGDLSLPRAGVSAERFAALAREVDAIVHCGAAVNWVYPYSALRDVNVDGTLELLRLAAVRGIPFHFISSLSVCYSSLGPPTAGEEFDALPYLRGVELGYAQTKVVAETLVREAGRRGLPVRIYRPPLISGHSVTGAYNRDDLITALVRGCVRMGTAPDLDWKLDCQPVDDVARMIVRLSGDREPVFHLGHERPRHWRECVLWMRMYGYPLRLVPYHTWLRQLEAETRSATFASHPLRPLRTFFLDRRPDSGFTLPELYEEKRRTQACSERTRKLLAKQATASRPLDAALLETYFTAFRQRGDLPAPAVGRSRISLRGGLEIDADLLGELLNREVRHVSVLGSGSDHSIVSELTAWRSGKRCGLFAVGVTFPDGTSMNVRLKAKAPDHDVIAVGESLASLIDTSLGDAYARWGDRIGFTMSHHREIEIYRQTDARFRQHAPALLGSIVDDGRGIWMMALEDVADALLDTADDPAVWTPGRVRTALDGLAALHAVWYGREAELRSKPWIGNIQTTSGMEEMTGLWTALAHQAAPAFSSWAQPDISTIQHRLIATIGHWWPALERGPRTLLHHDFNPRNIGIRHSTSLRQPDRRPTDQVQRSEVLCAYDWELATIGAPPRDLAEFLCFVLPPGVPPEDAQGWIDYYRFALQRETGTDIDADEWQACFQAGLYDLLLNRLATYNVVNRIRRQPYLPRVVRTWRRLYELTHPEER